MTDNEIIKALECCIKNNCAECPYCEFNDGYSCITKLMEDVFELHKNQQADVRKLQLENEKAKNYLAKCFDKYEKTKIAKESLENTVYTARAEAIKEFANNVKKHFIQVELVEYIDSLVEEVEMGLR